MNYYRELLRQNTRIEPFRRALRTLIGPKDRVLEVGAGLGTYSFFAAEAGAARVWAVEGDPIIHVAETIAKLNGYADKIEFFRGWIPDVSLPDRASVLIFEDFPPRLLDARTHRLMEKLYERYLTPDARWVPGRARLFAAPVHADRGIASPITPLGENDETAYGIDWTPTREYVANTANHMTIPASAVGKPPEVVADLSFLQLPRVDEIGGTARWTYEHDADINGIAYWFDLELSPGEWISNAPGVLPGSWAQLLLPLDPPVHVPGGESLSVGVKPEPLRDGAPGWLSWWASAAGVEVRGHEFASSPASFGDLYEESPDAVPRLSEKGLLESRALQLVDGERSVSEVAAELADTNYNVGEYEAVRLVLGALKGRTERPALSDFRSQ
jgi:protein arginine N-methyltransferase 1